MRISKPSGPGTITRRTLPDLNTDKGEHYADILAALYQRRIGDSAKRE